MILSWTMQALIHRLSSLAFPFNCQLNQIAQFPPQYLLHPPPLPLELWLEIFQFATYVHRLSTLKPLDPFTRKRTSRNAMALNTPAMAMRTKLSIVRVSRLWRSIASHILYEHLVIRSPARANLVLRVLEETRDMHASQLDKHSFPTMEYGQWVKHIEVHAYAHGASEIQYLKTLFRIFQLCPNARVLSGLWYHPLPVDFLNGIATIYGPNLQELYWNERGPDRRLERDTCASAHLLGAFKALRVLDLRHFIGRSDDVNGKADVSLSSRPTLPLVQDLIISAHKRSLVTAISLSLPALRNLTFKTSPTDVISSELISLFLRTHGNLLINVDLPTPSPELEPEYDTTQPPRICHVNPDVFLQAGVCPNLVSISYPVTSPQMAPHVHPCLRRIGLRGVRGDGLYPDKPSSCKDHLTAITPTRFPSLELVQTVGFLVEAYADDLVKDIFIWWAERFEKHGIDFLDGEGVLWAYTD